MVYVTIEIKKDCKEKYLTLFGEQERYKSNGSLIEFKGDNARHDYIISSYDLIGFYEYYKDIMINMTIHRRT
jgi:hypothetical protein